MANLHPDALEFVYGFLKTSDGPLRVFMPTMEDAYENYLVRPRNIGSLVQDQVQFPYLTGLTAQTSPILLKDPETHAAVSVMAANIFARTVGDAEFVRVVGSPDDPKIALWTRLISYYWRRPGHTHAFWKAILDACLYGVGWLKNTVEEEVRFPYRRVDVRADAGALVADYRPEEITFLEPALRYVNPFNFHPDWSGELGKSMVGGVEDGRMEAAKFKRFIQSKPDKFINKAALARALDKNTNAFHSGTTGHGNRWRQLAINGLTTGELKLPEAFRPVQFWSYRGGVPWKPVDSMERFRLIIIVNDEVVLDAPQPYYPHPYRSITLMPIGGRPQGVGPAEIGLQEQDQLDTIRTLQMQAAIRSTRQPILADGSMFEDAKELEDAPSGQVILTDGNPANATGAIKFDFSPTFSADLIARTGGDKLRSAMGIPALIGGVAAGARTTKAEIDQLTISSNLPLDIRVRLIEDEDMPRIAEDCGARYIFALRDEDNPDAALAIRLGLDKASLEDLVWTPGIQFIGSAQFRGQEGRAARLERLANFIMAVPGASAIANIPQMIVDIARIESPGEAERYLNDATAAISQAVAMRELAGANNGGRGMPSPPRATSPEQ